MLFENLCKIFEMRIKLDKEKNVKTSLDVLSNYEKYAKKIDSIYNSEFQKELKPFISPGVTLEKEKDRLRRLIKLLEDRLDRRVELEDRFYDTTGKYITGLQMIVSEEELDEKKERLSLVSRYLETSEEIEQVTNSINELKNLLNEEEKKKEEYETKNKIMEDELYSSFMSVIKDDDYYKNISEEDINSELDNIRINVSEAKETLDITKESVGSLITNGLEDDYASYVEEAEKNYYNYKNKELILNIYKLVINFEDDFKLICSKRERINDLISEKKELSENLVINVENELSSFEEVVLSQCDILDNEKDTLDNINNYNSRINFKEERLEELNEVNSSVEILSILREYGLIDTYDSEDVVLDEELSEISEIEIPTLEEEVVPSEEETEELLVEEVYDPYRIVEVNDYPKTLNVGLAKLKGEGVREKVNKKLNPKKEEPTFEEVSASLEEEKVEEVALDNEVLTLEPKKDEEVTEETPLVEDTLEKPEMSVEMPVWELPAENNTLVEETLDKTEVPVEMPVWELPTEVEPKPVTFESSEISPLPVWEAVKPEFNVDKVEEINNVNITETPNTNSQNKNEEFSNMFWVPVSEEKVDSNAFVNLNIPVNNNLNKNSEFVFPTINN